MRGEGGVAGEGRVVGVYYIVLYCFILHHTGPLFCKVYHAGT